MNFLEILITRNIGNYLNGKQLNLHFKHYVGKLFSVMICFDFIGSILIIILLNNIISGNILFSVKLSQNQQIISCTFFKSMYVQLKTDIKHQRTLINQGTLLNMYLLTLCGSLPQFLIYCIPVSNNPTIKGQVKKFLVFNIYSHS